MIVDVSFSWLQRNLTELRAMILDVSFVETCSNLTEVERTQLTLKWADNIQLYIITIDQLRGSFVIPSILQVNRYSFLYNIAIGSIALAN